MNRIVRNIIAITVFAIANAPAIAWANTVCGAGKIINIVQYAPTSIDGVSQVRNLLLLLDFSLLPPDYSGAGKYADFAQNSLWIAINYSDPIRWENSARTAHSMYLSGRPVRIDNVANNSCVGTDSQMSIISCTRGEVYKSNPNPCLGEDETSKQP